MFSWSDWFSPESILLTLVDADIGLDQCSYSGILTYIFLDNRLNRLKVLNSFRISIVARAFDVSKTYLRFLSRLVNI